MRADRLSKIALANVWTSKAAEVPPPKSWLILKEALPAEVALTRLVDEAAVEEELAEREWLEMFTLDDEERLE